MSRHGSRHIAAITLAAALVSVLASPAAASPRWSDWSEPVWLGAVVNSTGDEFGPAVSKDGLALYFASTRPGGLGAQDLWVSRRPSVDAAWAPPAHLGAVLNTAMIESGPALSRDGHWLFFMSFGRPGGSGGQDIWVSYRAHTHEDFGAFGWQSPTPLTSINTAANEGLVSYLQDDESGLAFLFFESNRAGGLGGLDLYVAVRQPGGSFGNVSNITELNSPSAERRPTVSHDGLEIIFSSDRVGTHGGLDLWTATRATTTALWSAPSHLGAISSTASDSGTYFSSDRQTLYFTSTRPGGLGGVAASDIWTTSRSKQTGKP